VKLLMFSHWSHTGFGTVTLELGSRLVGLGVDLRVLAVNHRGAPISGPLAGRLWPASIHGDEFAANISAQAIDGSFWPTLDPADKWKPDVVLVVSDVSGLLSHMGELTQVKHDIWKNAPVYHYCPIEGDNLPPYWRQLWDIVEPVAMSEYGARTIGEHIGRPVPVIYHGVDTDDFYPVSPGRPIRVRGNTLRSKEECKLLFERDPERLLLLRADRNAYRKFYPKTLEAFGLIAAREPNVDLILHCQPIDPKADGPDLIQELLRLPKDIHNRVGWTLGHDTHVGFSRPELNALYNAADIYISTTGGEGFGLTLAESMAAGTPVVVTDWAADRETVGDGGVLIPPLHDTYGQPVRFHHSVYGMDFAIPDARAFVQPTLDLLANKRARRELGAAGRLHVKRSFSWDVAASQFVDLFSQASEAAA
jgi:glycosyltransferase involved in cell wall biosynthesis